MKTLTVIGTRPEAIKMAPVITALDQAPNVESVVCSTGQHKEMLDQVFDVFDISPDRDLSIMKPAQSLADVTRAVLGGVDQMITDTNPDVVLVHGDTTTCFASALAAFYHNCPVAHVEAGLRTGDLSAPFPEEANRVLVGRIADLHFAPTESSRQNLLSEGIKDESIHVTGNTVIDALFLARKKALHAGKGLLEDSLDSPTLDLVSSDQHKTILITGHRRENFGQGFIDLCEAIAQLAREHPSWTFIYPVHLNPKVQEPVMNLLKSHQNIHLIAPVGYLEFVWLMEMADIILTDSGGVQEEGPSLGKPVLVMREVTERPEAVDAGTVRLVGTEKRAIIHGVEQLLTDDSVYDQMSKAMNPYGDGQASPRILKSLMEKFS